MSGLLAATSAGGGSPDEQRGSSPPVSPGDYAPSPNTSSQALHRANQLRVQNLLRRLLMELDEASQIDTVRVLRRTLREIDFQLSWLTQVDFLETIERLLRSEQQQQQQQRPKVGGESGPDLSWRLVHDASQLLLESMGRLGHQIDQPLLESIVPSVVENLGHSRSEVRRASLLLLNQMLNERPQHFRLLMRLFIDYGLTNYHNKQAQRGSILSLPLLISEQIVERGEDLGQLIRCLSELLLIDSNEQLFYSLFLAMQRIHLMIGDTKFNQILASCEPEAVHLYKQAASRSNSLVLPPAQLQQQTQQKRDNQDEMVPLVSEDRRKSSGRDQQQVEIEVTGDNGAEDELSQRQQQARQHVTFEHNLDNGHQQQPPAKATDADTGSGQRPISANTSDDDESLLSSSSSSSSSSSGSNYSTNRHAPQSGYQNFSSEVSSTCSSDAHLVNPAHYMTKAALEGHPLDHYDEIHHVDHSNVTSLAINDFGPICNTPTTELQPQPVANVHHNFSQLRSGSQQQFGRQLDSATPTGGLSGGLLSSELKFGIFPRHLIQATLNSPRGPDRYEAMQELMCLVRESPINHLAILMTYFDSFMEQFLAKILLAPASQHQQSDCKLELVAIDMIETIIIKTKVSTMQFIRPIVSLLMRSLAIDAAHNQQNSNNHLPTSQQQRLYLAPVSIFRDNTCRVLHKMMAYLPPQHVLDSIFEHKHHRSWLVREESINRVTAALLEYDRNEFNLTKLCYHILPMLADESPAVRLAALECMATLAHVLGPERIGTLLTAAEAVQTGCDYNGLLDAINARLMRHTLPRCQSNGIVRYALKPFLAHHQVAMATSGDGPDCGGDLSSSPLPPLAADVRWVLESPALHHNHHHHQGHDEGGHAHHHHSDHAHHRLGVYSPPTRDERRRRSSIGATPLDLIGLANDENPAEHHHNHHLHQDEHQHKPAAATAHRRRSTSTSQQQAGADFLPSNRDQARETAAMGQQDNSETRRQSGAGSGQQLPEQPAARTRRRSQPLAVDGIKSSAASGESNQHNSSLQRLSSQESELANKVARTRKPSICSISSSSAKEARKQQQNCRQQQQRPQVRKAPPMRRSSSQDSVSSTDTNKVLFQFYLDKFKQSLTECNGARQYQAVLPSDSIIYTDINQAYELSRRQSRFQQTSLELGASDGNGQEAVARNSDSLPSSLTSVAPQSNLNTGNRSREDKVRNNETTPTISGSRSLSRKRPSLSSHAHHQDQQDNQQNLGQLPAKQHLRQAAVSDDQQTSGSESPQTVREVGANSTPSPSSGPSRQAPAPLRSRPSIQRQTPIEAERLTNESPVRRRQSSPDQTTKTTTIRQDSSSGPSRRHTVSAIGAETVPVDCANDDGNGQRPEAKEVDEQQSFSGQRQRSRSISKHQSSSSGGTGHGHAQRQASGSQSGDSTSQRRERSLRRQESEAATVSSLATSVSSNSASLAREAQAGASSEQFDQEGRGLSEPHKGNGHETRAHHRRRAASKSQQRHHHSRASSQSQVSADKQQQQGQENVDGDQEETNQDHDHQNETEARDRRRATRRHASRDRRHNAGGSVSCDTRESAGSSPSGDQQVNRPTARLIRVHRQHGTAAETADHHSNSRRQLGGGLGSDQARSCLVSPSLSNSVNIRQLLENVAQLEGPFAEPQLALKVAMSALESNCWSTKVEGLLALIRLVAHHPESILTDGRLHEIVARTADETRNLRSTVARAAIFALGDYCARLKRLIEPELDVIVKCLLMKSIENTTFIRDDLKRALTELVDHLTPWRLATLLIQHGGQHKSVHVRKMASQFVAQCCDRLGPAKALVGAREISHLLLPAAARFAQDQSPHTRYYGRLILSKLMHHSSFERLLRRNLTSTLYRSTIGIIESIKRRGCGQLPEES